MENQFAKPGDRNRSKGLYLETADDDIDNVDKLGVNMALFWHPRVDIYQQVLYLSVSTTK
jgi:hypothetical protein